MEVTTICDARAPRGAVVLIGQQDNPEIGLGPQEALVLHRCLRAVGAQGPNHGRELLLEPAPRRAHRDDALDDGRDVAREVVLRVLPAGAADIGGPRVEPGGRAARGADAHAETKNAVVAAVRGASGDCVGSRTSVRAFAWHGRPRVRRALATRSAQPTHAPRTDIVRPSGSLTWSVSADAMSSESQRAGGPLSEPRAATPSSRCPWVRGLPGASDHAPAWAVVDQGVQGRSSIARISSLSFMVTTNLCFPVSTTNSGSTGGNGNCAAKRRSSAGRGLRIRALASAG
jgi:hypothetical protein